MGFVWSLNLRVYAYPKLKLAGQAYYKISSDNSGLYI